MAFLTNPRVLKVGVRVQQDLALLQSESHSGVPFVGATDLAKYAKDRYLIPRANIGLADLCDKAFQRMCRNVSAQTGATPS
jgi:hypothetical protein